MFSTYTQTQIAQTYVKVLTILAKILEEKASEAQTLLARTVVPKN